MSLLAFLQTNVSMLLFCNCFKQQLVLSWLAFFISDCVAKCPWEWVINSFKQDLCQVGILRGLNQKYFSLVQLKTVVVSHTNCRKMTVWAHVFSLTVFLFMDYHLKLSWVKVELTLDFKHGTCNVFISCWRLSPPPVPDKSVFVLFARALERFGAKLAPFLGCQSFQWWKRSWCYVSSGKIRGANLLKKVQETM